MIINKSKMHFTTSIYGTQIPTDHFCILTNKFRKSVEDKNLLVVEYLKLVDLFEKTKNEFVIVIDQLNKMILPNEHKILIDVSKRFDDGTTKLNSTINKLEIVNHKMYEVKNKMRFANPKFLVIKNSLESVNEEYAKSIEMFDISVHNFRDEIKSFEMEINIINKSIDNFRTMIEKMKNTL